MPRVATWLDNGFRCSCRGHLFLTRRLPHCTGAEGNDAYPGGVMRSPDEHGRSPLPDELSECELAAESAMSLPDRQLMSTIRVHPGIGHIAVPINEALALNQESPDSVAFADAGQTVVMGPLDPPQTPSLNEGG